MQNETNESVGQLFKTDLLQAARDKTLQVIMKAAAQVKAGMSELETRKLVQEIQSEMGASKSWHPPQIRFGENTLLPFGEVGKENQTLKENDIFFLDIGPLFQDHEGDVGRAFYVGQDEEMKKCCHDVELIWHEVRNHWAETQLTGLELYKFATESAQKKGWILTLESANGHRISDFPHIARSRGTIEEFPQKPAANRWILEIQIRHPEKPFGAFYEDLLN